MSKASCPKSDPEFVDALREFLGLSPIYADPDNVRLLREREGAIVAKEARDAAKAWAEYERWRDRRRAERAKQCENF